MWLSKKMAPETEVQSATEGLVSVGGSAPAAVLDGEQRQLAVASPGGYFWCPRVEEQVLVLQGHVIGAVQAEKNLRPGEICISSGKASIRLGIDGAVYIDGDIFLNGERWEA